MEAPTQTCERCRTIYDTWEGSCPHCSGREVKWPRPIPVSERLPEVDKRVLWSSGGEWECGVLGVFENDGSPQFDFHAGEYFYIPDYDGYGYVEIKKGVTHWLPLPPNPE